MGKRNKKTIKPLASGAAAAAGGNLGGNASLATRGVQPPAKNPTLLGVSLILFALWFVFLLVTALFG